MSAFPLVRRIVFALLAFSATVPLAAQPFYSGTLVYNTNQPDFGSFPVVEAAQWLAQPFTTGANPALFNSATIYEKTFWPQGNFWVSIYSDNNGAPGSTLAGGLLNGPSAPQGFSFLTYTATLPISLTANTTYWIVASSDSPATYGGAYGWAWAANNNYSSPVDWTFGYEAFTSDQGANWTSSTDYTPSRLLTAINGSIVPEPSATSLLIGSSILLVFGKKRKN
jgi:hypothetical protein